MNPHESLFLFATLLTGCDRALAGEPAQPPPPSDPHPSPARHAASSAKAVVDFWRDAGPKLWFAKEPEFDRRFRERFSTLHEAAATGSLAHWLATPEGALALTLLLDQYPRNSFRGTSRMYVTDALALRTAADAIARGHDRQLEPELRLFLYLPYAHSEQLADQERSVELSRSLGEPTYSRAQHHRDIIRRFGRFPHRNAILGRAPRPEELQYLAEGGFAG